MLRRVGCDALVFVGERAAEPYVVACDYDEWRGTWASERRYADASEAWDDIDSDVIDGTTVRWRRSDFAKEIEERGGIPEDGLVEEVVERVMNMGGWRESAVRHQKRCLDEAIGAFVVKDPKWRAARL